MPQIPKRATLNFILSKAKDFDEGHIIRVENHKNDRFLEIKILEEKVQVKEDCYTNTIHNVEMNGLKSLLNQLIEYEFPRSHKFRIKIRSPN